MYVSTTSPLPVSQPQHHVHTTAQMKEVVSYIYNKNNIIKFNLFLTDYSKTHKV